MLMTMDDEWIMDEWILHDVFYNNECEHATERESGRKSNKYIFSG